MIKIENEHKKTLIAEKASICSSFCCKAIGLMFSPRPRTILFRFSAESRHSLHMFFVFFPIDLVFLDREKKVVELKSNFRPFTLYDSANKAMFVIECPAGTIRKSGTSVGDKVKF